MAKKGQNVQLPKKQNATLGKLKIPKVTRLKKNTIPNLIKMK